MAYIFEFFSADAFFPKFCRMLYGGKERGKARDTPGCETKKLRYPKKVPEFLLAVLSGRVAGVAETASMDHVLPSNSIDMLNNIGFVQDIYINAILRLDKFFERRFWNKLVDKMSKNY